jgi:hypothetical protein
MGLLPYVNLKLKLPFYDLGFDFSFGSGRPACRLALFILDVGERGAARRCGRRHGAILSTQFAAPGAISRASPRRPSQAQGRSSALTVRRAEGERSRGLHTRPHRRGHGRRRGVHRLDHGALAKQGAATAGIIAPRSRRTDRGSSPRHRRASAIGEQARPRSWSPAPPAISRPGSRRSAAKSAPSEGPAA